MVIEELIAAGIKHTLSIHAHVLFLTPRREGHRLGGMLSDTRADDTTAV